MTNPRLIVLEEEEVARLQLIRRHEGNDLSPNDEALLEALVARYEDGITEDEGRGLAGTGPITPQSPCLCGAEVPAHWCPLDREARRKLRAAFTPPTQRSDSE